MALKKTTPAADVASTTPAFEDESTTQTAVEVQAEAPAAATPAKDPTVAATTAIATASSTGAVTVNAAAAAANFKKELEEMQGAFDFSYGNFPIFKGSNGAIAEMGNGKTRTMGRWAKVRMMGWDDSYQISPGEDGSRTKDFVAFSKDGITIDSVIGEEQRHFVGRPVTEYVTYLKNEEKFTKAASSRYINIACYVLEAEKPGFENESVQVTLSQSSIPAFQTYQQQLKMQARAAAMNLPGATMSDDPFTFYFGTEDASKGSNRWTKLKISAKKPD